MLNKIITFLFPLAFFLIMVSCSANPSEEVKIYEAQIMNYDYNADEIDLGKLINEYRVSIGLNELVINNHISYKSKEHNNYMIANNVVDHSNFQERADNIIRVLNAVKVNENLAYNYTTSQGVLSAWLNSPGHKANIESDATHFGISVSISAVTNKKYYTTIFIKK